MVNTEHYRSKLKAHATLTGRIGDLLVDLQAQVFEWCGHTRSSGIDSLNTVRDRFGDDADIQAKLRLFSEAMTFVVRYCSPEVSQLLSDSSEGGSTKVISVKHSEVEDGTTGSAPPQGEQMSQVKEEEQKKQLAMARHAAVLQQDFLAELLTMDEDSRAAALKDAKECHDNFLARALSIPAGPERVAFMQNLDPGLQKKLITHKMWEQMIANNGGVAPVIHTNN